MDNHGDKRLTTALVLSLLLHFLFILFLTFPGALPRFDVSRKEVEVVLQGKAIADIAPPEHEEKPAQAKFLGLYDSRVEEEKVALTPDIPPERRRVATGKDGRALSQPGRKSETGTELAMKSPEQKFLEGERGEDLSSNIPEDFFPNITVGERTYLNVLRYPKISYFVRMKKIIKLTWNPLPIVNQYYFSSQLAKGKIETTVALQVDREGNMVRLFIHQSSGLPAFDDEALRAIQDSAPFAAPPRELLDADGILPLVYTFIVFL